MNEFTINVNVTVNPSAELSTLLQKFFAIADTTASTDTAETVNTVSTAPAKGRKKSAPAPATETEEAGASNGTEDITLESLREFATTVSTKNGNALKNQVKAIIKEHGADSLKLLDKKHYPVVYKKIKELDASEEI